MKRGFAFAILGFLTLFFAQSLSGIWLYHLKYGWSPAQLNEAFYSPNGHMSWPRFGKTAFVHVAVIAILTFVLGHFLSFVHNVRLKLRIFLAVGLITSGILNALSGAVPIRFGAQWVVVKLATFVLFQMFLLSVTFIILKAALSALHSTSSTKS